MGVQKNKDSIKQRVVVIGGGGFVGSEIVSELQQEGVNVLALARNDIDLTSENASSLLKSLLIDDDIIVAAAAVAPAKNVRDLQANILLAKNIADAVGDTKISYFLNISSDAIYGDEPLPLDESSPKAPSSFHGLMHLTREQIFSEMSCPFANIRPTLIYGRNDPHNGYGPNRFLRSAKSGEDIKLFGEGEEIRDHVWIKDVAKLALEMLASKTVYSLNAVSGDGISFRNVGEIIIEKTNSGSHLITNPRNGPMPHNGLRTFDNSKVHALFPKFRFTKFKEGIEHCF